MEITEKNKSLSICVRTFLELQSKSLELLASNHIDLK